MSKSLVAGKRPLAIFAALSITVAMAGAPVERAFAWGAGGGGGSGGPAQKSKLDKTLEKINHDDSVREAKEQRERENGQRDDKKEQAKEDSQYRPGFAFGPGGDMNLSK
jgi:hypothetical protein